MTQLSLIKNIIPDDIRYVITDRLDGFLDIAAIFFDLRSDEFHDGVAALLTGLHEEAGRHFVDQALQSLGLALIIFSLHCNYSLLKFVEEIGRWGRFPLGCLEHLLRLLHLGCLRSCVTIFDLLNVLISSGGGHLLLHLLLLMVLLLLCLLLLLLLLLMLLLLLLLEHVEAGGAHVDRAQVAHILWLSAHSSRVLRNAEDDTVCGHHLLLARLLVLLLRWLLLWLLLTEHLLRLAELMALLIHDDVR